MLLKFCGLKRRSEFELAAQLGVDYCGINLVPESVRYLDLAGAVKETHGIPLKLVLVVRDLPPASIAKMALALPNTVAVQLHGSETVDAVQSLRALLPRMQIWKAIGIHSPADISLAEPFVSHVDLLLLDAKAQPGSAVFGGEGKSFDWQLLRAVPLSAKLWGLSGGINAANLNAAIEQHPTLIDIASGIEVERGIKSLELMTKISQQFRRPKGT